MLDFLPKIFKFNSFCGLMPPTSSSLPTCPDGRLRLHQAVLGTIEVNGWKLWKQKHRALEEANSAQDKDSHTETEGWVKETGVPQANN